MPTPGQARPPLLAHALILEEPSRIGGQRVSKDKLQNLAGVMFSHHAHF
jgi:hypothetical protein